MQRMLSSLVTLASIAFALASSALAQGYPARPVRVITLTAAGGSLDIMARTLAQSLTETMGQQFYVENKLGAGGNIGVAELGRSAPDGYTIGMITVSTHGINPSLYGSKLPFDALNDFEILAIAAELKNVVVVNPKVPATNMQELVRYAKDNPGKINFGSAGVGTSQHMAGELFKHRAKIDINHIAYKGAAQAAPDLVSGEIQLMFSSIPDMLRLHPGGQAPRHRHLDQEPLSGAAERGARGGAGLPGLRCENLVRARRTQGHVAGDRRRAQPADQRDAGETRREGPSRQDGPRHRRAFDAGAEPGLRQTRDRSVGDGGESGEHPAAAMTQSA